MLRLRLPLPLLARFALCLAGLCVMPAARAADEPRFSSSLSTPQMAETGLDRLTSDNVAVIDALVRQDQAATRFVKHNIYSTRFSQRRTEHERDIAGLGRLTPEQLAKLDAFVSLRIPKPEVQLDATQPYSSVRLDTTSRVVMAKRPGPEIHGSFSLTYGMSKAGSVRGGSSTISYVDRAHGLTVQVGYSEYHGKGLAPYVYPDDGSAPYYRPAPVFNPEDR